MFDPHASTLCLGIIGSGTIGRGIAQIAAASGIRVLLADARDGAADEARAAVAATFDRLAAKGRMTAEAAGNAKACLHAVAGYAPAFRDCHVVVEAIVEDLEVKRSLFGQLEAIVAPDCVLRECHSLARSRTNDPEGSVRVSTRMAPASTTMLTSRGRR